MSNQLQVSGAAKIRTIQGPVVANSGVITALDGDASEYVRGDGTLADFPTSTGGGSSVSYYLNTSVSQGTIGGVAYKQLSKVPISGAGTDVTISANGYVASYITDANDPALLEVPAGNFNCEFYFSVNSNAHNPYVYAEVYKYDGTTFTLLGSNVSIPQYLSNGTTLSPYYFAIAVSTAVLTVTDRIAIRIYVNVDTRTVTLHTENNHLCQVVTTFSKGLISLNNLTRQNQFFATGTSGTDFAISSATATHTFNLPVASAANTGKLSSTDWSTFNSKESALTFTSPLVRTTNTISIPAATTSVSGYLTSTDWTTFNNKFTLPALTQGSILFSDGSTIAQNNSKLYWDNSNMRLGIGVQSQAQYVMYVAATIATNANAWLGIDNPNTTGSTALRLILNGATTSGFQYVQSTNMTQIFANAGDIQLINSGSLGLTIANTTGNATFSASATATSFVKSGGTSSQFLKADGSVDSTTYGTGSVTSVATSAPLTGGTITTSGTIGITQATTSANGYLSSTDWNTFNGKFTLPSLTSGSVLFSNGSTIAQDNANFFWDDVNNRLGIGTSSPTEILHILGASAIVYIDGNSAGTQTSSTLRLRTGGFNVGNFRYNVATDNIEISNVSAGGAVTSGAVKIYGTSGSTTGLTIAAAGGGTFASTLTVGTTAFVTNDIFIGDTTSGSGRFFITDSSNQGITLRRAGAADRFKMFVGNGTTYTQDNCIILGTNTDIDFYTGSSPVKRLTIANSGVATFSSDIQGGGDLYFNKATRTTIYPTTTNQNLHMKSNGSGVLQFNNDNTGNLTMCVGGGNVGIGTSSPTSQATGATSGILDVSAATGGNLVLHRTSGGDTALFSILKSSNGTYIDSTGAATAANNAIYFRNNNNNADQTSLHTRLTITSGGNVLIGTTTDSGFNLQVNGSSRLPLISTDNNLRIADTNVAYTLFTISAYGLYIVYVDLPAGSGTPSDYSSYAIISHDGSTARILQQTNGALMFITLSGNNVQGRQTSGGQYNIRHVYQRIGA